MIPRVLGRYVLHDEIASGGMASVYFGRLTGAVGFSRTVAIKRLHPHLAKEPDFVTMLIDEARLAARIVHPNVVPTLDVVAEGDEVFIVMEYVQGEALSRLQHAMYKRGERAALHVALTVIIGALHGLHAAHEAKNELGEPLGIVHRDVSPQNVLVGADGTVRVLDFGVAKAAGKLHSTREGSVKGKVAYMAPEQIRGGQLTRRSDIYAAGVLLWELLTGRRLFDAENDVVLVHRITSDNITVDAPSVHNAEVSPELDALVLRALAHAPEARFATAREMAQALEHLGALASASTIGDWVSNLADDALSKRASIVSAMEAIPSQSGGLPALSGAHSALTPSTGIPGVHTVSSPPSAPAKSRTTRVVALGAVGVAVLAGVLGGVLWPGARGVGQHASSPSFSKRVAALPGLPAAPPPAAEPVRPAEPVASAAPPVTQPAPAKPAVAPARPKERSCDPPYEIDAAGHRTYKRWCLK